jgi:hypothetical protein
MFPYPLPDDATQSIYEIGVRATADSDLRRTAWTMLGWTSLGPTRLVAASAQTLANDLLTHPNEDVQRAAAYALTQHIDDPEVREVVAHSLSEDLSQELRQTLNSALQGAAP